MLKSFLRGFGSFFGLAAATALMPLPLQAHDPLPAAKPKKRRGRARSLYHPARLRGKYLPHQGAQEIARRKRQIDAAQLRVSA